MPRATALALADPPSPLPEAHEPSPPADSATVVPLPKKRGPNTPEGKARSRQNALKHGLRAKLLPPPPAGDDAAHFQELAADLRRTYRPEDAAEAQLVEAMAVAMWQEITADRLEAEALAAMAGGDGTPFHGGLLLEAAANRATLHTVLRYQASASCAVGRAMRLFFQHRRAKRDGLLATGDEAADEISTNELPLLGTAPANDDSDRREAPPPTEAAPQARTNEPTGFRHNMPPLPPTFTAAPDATPPPAQPLPAPANRTNEFPSSTARTAPARRSDLHPVRPAPAAAQENGLPPSTSG
jgi:hypothetical protein